jgi:hypothetical protein
MLDFSLSVLPFIVIAVANFIISWLYYSPAVPWFRAWQKGVGMDPDKEGMTDEEKRAMPRLFAGAIAATFLLSYGLQIVIHSVKVDDFGTGALLGLVVWFGFVLTHSLNTQFEGRKPVVLVINNVLYLITYVVYGGILAVWN